MSYLNMVGKKFGRLLVTERLPDRFSPGGYRRYYYLCKCNCGNSCEVNAANLTKSKFPTKSCGCLRKEYIKNQPLGKLSPTWKGGRRIDGGYVMIYQKDHPKAKKNGYVREHVLIMETILGRPLVKGENVHHKNGNKLDNNPVNLELWNTSQPSGQRIEDKLKWAEEIVKLYG